MRRSFAIAVPLVLGAAVAAVERAPRRKTLGRLRSPRSSAPRTRYLSAAHLPAAERRELYAVVSYHVNGLSRESKRVPPRKVAEWLWAVDLADYHRLAGHRGGKRACLAVGHRILRMVHNLLSSHRPYEEGGPDYYRPTDTDRLKGKLVQRLKKLGFDVTVAAAETAA